MKVLQNLQIGSPWDKGIPLVQSGTAGEISCLKKGSKINFGSKYQEKPKIIISSI